MCWDLDRGLDGVKKDKLLDGGGYKSRFRSRAEAVTSRGETKKTGEKLNLFEVFLSFAKVPL